MGLKMRKYLSAFLCFVPSLCFGIELDTKIAWEPWAINSAVMDFCMPELADGKTISYNTNGHWLYNKEELSSLGNVPMLITNWNEGGVINRETVKMMPKCAAFIDAYIAQSKKNNKVSLNQIITMCLDTIQDKLICENITLVLVNLTENKKVLKNYDPQKMQQKIQESIKADHTICSSDGKFCTTYNLFSEDRTWTADTSVSDFGSDAIFTTADKQIVGVCAGVDRKNLQFLSILHTSERCVATKPGYELYEFDIQDFTDKSIELKYTDYGVVTNKVKQYLETIKIRIQDLEKCLAKKQVTAETSRALNSDHIVLGLTVCEKDNASSDAIAICKTQVLKAQHKKTTQNVQELTFEKAESRLDIYKSMLDSYFLTSMVLRHQTDLLLTDCENQYQE